MRPSDNDAAARAPCGVAAAFFHLAVPRPNGYDEHVENPTMPEHLMRDADTASLTVSRSDAERILEALRMLVHCRLFSFKQPDEDVRQLHREVFELYERIASQVHDAFPRQT